MFIFGLECCCCWYFVVFENISVSEDDFDVRSELRHFQNLKGTFGISLTIENLFRTEKETQVLSK